MNNPWIFESGNIDFSVGVEEMLLRNESINKYLSTDGRDKYLFLVGPKGIGKTLLLNYKSYLLRQHHKEAIKFSPALELSENLSVYFTTFSKEELVKFKSLDLWENVWKFVLLGVSCRTYGIDIEEKLKIEDVNFSKASNILTYILKDRKHLNKILSNGLPKLLSLAGSIQSGVNIFIDGIDQAITSFVDKSQYDYVVYKDMPSEVWANIHIGLAKSIYDISKLNTHIKIYTTLRSEAFRLIPGGMGLNLDGFAIHLSYSPQELKEIFYNNVKLMDRNKLFDSETENSIESFLGYTDMPHPFVAGQKENALDFILRHTLGRPREVVLLGNKLFYDKVSKNDYKNLTTDEMVEDVRFFINDKSEEIISSYLREIIPFFDENYLNKFLKKIQSNIFHYKILNDEEKDFLGICFNIGLIGIINHKINGKGENIKVQYFKSAGDYVYHDINHFPKSDFYITHPILDCYLVRLFNLDFYNANNIIGHDYKFTTPEYLYDYAISYSNKDKDLVEYVSTELKAKGLKIFYDKDFEKDFNGEDLIDYLYNVYKKSAKKVIIFISENYLKTKWTSFEFSAIKHRLLNDYNSNFIKIIRIDNTEIPEIIETRSYIDANKKSPAEIIKMLE